MGPTALHPVQQLHQAWGQPQSQEGRVVRNFCLCFPILLPAMASLTPDRQYIPVPTAP